jgi:hypothetical protein
MSSIGALKHSIITVSVTIGSMCQDVIMLFISVLVVYRIVWLGGATRFGNSWHCEMTKQGRRRVPRCSCFDLVIKPIG